MNNSLAQLFESFDSKNCNAIGNSIMNDLAVQVDVLPFLKLTTAPTHITCPGCEESCHAMPVRKLRGENIIWCDKPQNLGTIRLSKEELEKWRLDLSALADLLVKQLSLNNATCLIDNRVYDLGIFEGRALILMRGADWPDALDLFKDKRIYNEKPLFITLSPPPESLSFPAIWLWQLLNIDNNGRPTLDKERLYTALGIGNITAGNTFRKLGDMWLVRFNGKETFIKHSNGMFYIHHLLQHANEEMPAITLQAIINKPHAPNSMLVESNFDDMSVPVGDMVMDAQTKKAITNRIEILKETEPDSSEILELEQYLSAATYKGKSKVFAGNNELARVAITKAIGIVLKKIKTELPKLYSHFEGCINTGAFCSYKPIDKIKW